MNERKRLDVLTNNLTRGHTVAYLSTHTVGSF